MIGPDKVSSGITPLKSTPSGGNSQIQKVKSSPDLKSSGKVTPTSSSPVTKTKSQPQMPSEQVDGKQIKVLSKTTSKSTLQSQETKIPTPQMLLDARSNLNQVETTVKTGLESAKQEFLSNSIQDSGLMSNTKIEDKAVQRVVNDGNVSDLFQDKVFKELSTDYTRALVNAGQNEDLVGNLSEMLKRPLKNFDKYNQGPLKNQSKIKSATALGGQHLQKQIATISSMTDFSALLNNKSESEIKELVTQAVGQLKKYDGKQLNNLSDNKQAFINQMTQNIMKGLDQQVAHGVDLKGSPVQIGQEGNLAKTMKKLTTHMQQKVSSLDSSSDLAYTLTLKSNSELSNMFSDVIGHKSSGFMKAMMKGIDSGLPNRIDGHMVSIPTKENKPNVDVPNSIKINGESYGQPKYLTQGGFGFVLSYTSLDDPNKQVVVKQPLVNGPSGASLEQLREEAIDEINAHREVLGPNGHPNIVGLHGALKGPNGQIFIVQELASKGDLNGVNEKLKGALDSGAINKQTHDLLSKYLAKGVLQGMKHLQEDRQMTHFDTKLPNMLLDGQGNVKQTDFGLTRVGSEFDMESRVADNPLYQAPELADIKGTKNDVIIAKIKQEHGLDWVEKPDFFKRPKPPEDTNDLEAMAVYEQKKLEYDNQKIAYDEYQAIFKPLSQNDHSTVKIDNKSDTWAVGIALHELFLGDPLNLNWDQRMYKIDEKLAEVRKDPDFRTRSTTDLNSIALAKAILANPDMIADNPKLNTKTFKELAKAVSLPDVSQENLEAFNTMMNPVNQGVGGVDKLLNGLLHPNPEKRMTLDSALKMSVFNDSRLDGQEIKTLLLAVTEKPPNSETIKHLVGQLGLQS